jgi:uncharacterized membrane protein YccC
VIDGGTTVSGRTHDVRALLWSAAPGRDDWTSGYRLACALVLPIAVGVAIQQPRTGLFVGVGAFVVGNAYLDRSYQHRLRLMAPTTLLVTLLTVLGMTAGTNRFGSVFLSAVVLLIGGLAAAFGREAALLGTLVSFGYVVGVGVAGLAVGQVVLPMLAGGAFAMLLAWLEARTVQRRTDELPEPWSTLVTRSRAHLDTAVIRRACALAIAGGLGLAVLPFAQDNGAWLLAGTLIVLKPGYRDTVRAGLLRAGGTVLGAAAAGAIAASGSGLWALLAIASVIATAAGAAHRRSFAAFVVLIAPISVLVSNALLPAADWSTAYLRTADLAIGAGLAILVASTLYPHRWLRSAAEHDEATARPR